LLQDYRDGRLGRITLETPLTRRAMLDASLMVPAGAAVTESPVAETSM